MARFLRVYRPLARVAHRVLPLWRGPLGEALRGRRAAPQRWVAWAATLPSPRCLLWVHAASVGEWLAVAPVVRRLKTQRPELLVALSYSSPSLKRWPQPADADHADFIPPDEPALLASLFGALRPALVLIARGDLWPELLAAAQRHDTPVAVAGGAISPSSRRLAWPWRLLFEQLTGSLVYVGAVTAEDASRYGKLGAHPNAIVVTGDPRHDQALERVSDLASITPLLAWGAGGGVMVAGSTHPMDESLMLDAFATVERTIPHARLLVVPHDPGAAATERVISRARSLGLVTACWPGQATAAARIVVVEAVGLLADLYLCGQVAYVGGGFRAQGVHAVSEPAAYAVPVIFGPLWSRSRDASHLYLHGGGVALPRREAAAALVRVWQEWLTDSAARTDAGLRARGALTAGAASVTATVLLSLLERCSPRTSPSGGPPAQPSAR